MLDFGLLEVVVLRRAAVDVVRDAVGGVGSAAVRGDFVRGGPLPLAPRNGDAVLVMPGVPVREGGLLGRLIEGLSHEEKKSSGSPAGVLVPLPSSMSAPSSTTTLSGFLVNCQHISSFHKTFSLNILLLVRLNPSRQLILVLVRRIARVLLLRILACKRCCSAV